MTGQNLQYTKPVGLRTTPHQWITDVWLSQMCADVPIVLGEHPNAQSHQISWFLLRTTNLGDRIHSNSDGQKVYHGSFLWSENFKRFLPPIDEFFTDAEIFGKMIIWTLQQIYLVLMSSLQFWIVNLNQQLRWTKSALIWYYHRMFGFISSHRTV